MDILNTIWTDYIIPMDLTPFYHFFDSYLRISGIYLVYCFFHYTIPHLYTNLCVPTTFYGFISSPFMSQAPHCVAMRWTLYNVGDNLKTGFALLAGWISGLLFAKQA